jgi:hypothetical protein
MTRRQIAGMAGRYTGSYLDRSNGWRAVAILADFGQASLVGRIPKINYDLHRGDNQGLVVQILAALRARP